MAHEDFRLTSEQVQFYKDNGYLIAEGVFSHDECDKLLKIYMDRADEKFSGIMNLDREVKEVKDFVSDPRMVIILEQLQGGEVSLLQTMFLFKQVNSPYESQAWNPHQDNAYPQARWGAYITGNVPLVDQDPENGGMYIYPGSHREEVLPNVKVKSFHEAPGTQPGHCVEVPGKYTKVDLRMKKGAVLMLHGNVIHGSYPNNSKTRSRPMLLIPYLSRGEQFIPGVTAQRKEFPLPTILFKNKVKV